MKKDGEMPSASQNDGIDYVPTNRSILFGHHFSSVAGAAPILGPAIAIIWGWLPALIWIVFGSIFIGAVHDFGALFLSALFDGKSIGSITGDILGRNARLLFLIIIFILVFIVIAVFAYIIATLFVLYPGSVIPINFEIIVAIIIGRLVVNQKISLIIPSILALIGLYIMIYVGHIFPVSIPAAYALMGSPVLTWVMFLMIYGFIAAVLPVTVLLQPRDLINAHQLVLGLILIYIGMFLAQPIIVAPVVNFQENDVSWFPYLFITIACGAVSGFHALVASGTTSKQLKSIKDARTIGYGAMMGEATLAIAATLAVASGFDRTDQWLAHYNSFEGAQGLTSKLSAFVGGTATFINPIFHLFNIDHSLSNALSVVFISVLVISFAATSLDTAVRIQRYVVGEIAISMKIKFIENRFVATFIAVMFSVMLVLSDDSGSGGIILWPLFGTTNQLLGALTLMVISIWLYLKKRNYWVSLIPLILLLFLVSVASIFNMIMYFQSENWLLFAVDIVIISCYLWLLSEGLMFLITKKGSSDP